VSVSAMSACSTEEWRSASGTLGWEVAAFP
jgi:hypothetical protein